ncbi:hypothetical protein L598_002600000020 [Mesorhizobium sp. J18]|nr:hypothetical protein L598_002600000020 [Mesorhizobium sp. J18]
MPALNIWPKETGVNNKTQLFWPVTEKMCLWPHVRLVDGVEWMLFDGRRQGTGKRGKGTWDGS